MATDPSGPVTEKSTGPDEKSLVQIFKFTYLSIFVCNVIVLNVLKANILLNQGSHFFGLTKFHDISMIFPGFLVNFQLFFDYF